MALRNDARMEFVGSAPRTIFFAGGDKRSAMSLGIFWRADVLVRRRPLENGGRGRPPSN